MKHPLILILINFIFSLSVAQTDNSTDPKKNYINWHINFGATAINKLKLICKEEPQSSPIWVNSKPKFVFNFGFFKQNKKFSWGLSFLTFKSEFSGKTFNRIVEVPGGSIGLPSTFINFDIQQKFSFKAYQLGFEMGLLNKKFKTSTLDLNAVLYYGYKTNITLNNYYINPQYDTAHRTISKNVLIYKENSLMLPNFGLNLGYNYYFTENTGIAFNLNSYIDILNNYPNNKLHDNPLYLYKAFEGGMFGYSYFAFKTKSQFMISLSVGLNIKI